MKRSFPILIICLCLLLTTGSNSFAQTKKVVLATGEWFPYTSESIEGYGVFTEIVSAAFQEIGVEPVYKFMPWRRAERMVETGEIFAAFPYVMTEERSKIFEYSEPVIYSTGRLFYSAKRFSEEIPFKTIQDLKPYTIGGVRGYWYESLFRKAHIQAHYVNSEKQIIKMLYANRVDLVPMDEMVGWHLIRQLYPQNVNSFKTFEKPLNRSSLHLLVSRKYENASKLTMQFNMALEQIRRNGVYRRILERHGVQE